MTIYTSFVGCFSLLISSKAPFGGRSKHVQYLWGVGICIGASIFLFLWHRILTFDLWELFFVLSSCLSYWFFLRFGMVQLPESFTFGEAHLVCQLISLGFAQGVRYSFSQFGETPTGETVSHKMISSLVVALTVGMLLIGVFSWFSLKKQQGYRSLAVFGVVFLAVVFGLIQPWIYLVTGQANPWWWTIQFIVSSPIHFALFFYWAIVLILVLFVFNLPSWSSRFPLIIVRKFYHLLAFAMFAPGILYAPDFLALSYAVGLSGLLFAEWIRFGNLPPLGPILRHYIGAFVDSRDCGPIVTTHLYLLVGCAMPLWLSFDDKFAPFAGLLTLGMGDTMASLIGIHFGRHKWPSSKKSIQGTLAGILSIILPGLLCQYVLYGALIPKEAAALVFSAIGIMILEAITLQIDNIFLPLWFIVLHNLFLILA